MPNKVKVKMLRSVYLDGAGRTWGEVIEVDAHEAALGRAYGFCELINPDDAAVLRDAVDKANAASARLLKRDRTPDPGSPWRPL